MIAAGSDPHEGGIPLAAPVALGPFVEAGVLAAADVHVARTLARLLDEYGEAALLGAALAVRAPRLGHVCVDLAGVRESVVPSDDSTPGPLDLPWPEPAAWAAGLRKSALVGEHGPLRLEGSLLYLDRYWGQERAVAAGLLRRAAAPPLGDPTTLRGPLAHLFPGPAFAEQSAAAATALLRRLSVIAGGPGTGKTTTIARILALVDEVEGLHPRRVALAAPTGKAAARLEESVHEEAAAMAVGDETRARLLALGSSTIHRLLGRRPDSDSRFRHDRANPLPHTLVVVDEASMISLSLMARLLEALREDARLVLVGDPEQLVSVEAGAVLGDVVGPARTGARMRPDARRALEEATGGPVEAAPTSSAIGDGVVLLRRVHRFGAGIAELADAVRRGDGEAVVAALSGGREGVRWLAADPAVAEAEPVRDMAVAAGTRLIALARAGDAPGALAALGDFRLLCAHRRGPYGVAAWTDRVEGWLEAHGAVPGAWYPGCPLLVGANDYGLRLFNGDTGVIVVRDGGPPLAAFARAGEVVEFSPGRVASLAPVHAMTIHKSQGSQFRRVAVLLPPPGSPILTRELLYTAITRASEEILLVGDEAAVRDAVARPVARASGLRRLLWGDE
jgi:exodeoxyribonuclease V alpha subunit